MTGVGHQTVSLSAGRHRSPREGACAMELASLLGDERFSDHPQRVCPVLAAFLRGYNDTVGPRLRQELFGIASSVVDSRTADAAERDARAAALVGFSIDLWRRRGRRFRLPPSLPAGPGYVDVQAAGAYAGRFARRDRSVHDRTLAFVEDLAGRERWSAPGDAPPTPPARVAPPAALRG